MVADIVRWIAFALVLGAVVCVAVMFVGGLSVMFDVGRMGNPAFDAVVARIRQLRVWGLAGIGLFSLACVLLWFTPDRRANSEWDRPL